MAFTTYYETGNFAAGTHQIHRKIWYKRADAMRSAKSLSLETDGFVTVLRRGFEIASFLNGQRST